MKKKVLIYAFSLLGIILPSCRVDPPDDNKQTTSGGIYYDERTSDREYFEKVGTNLLQYINPEEQRQTLIALDQLAEYLDTYEMPESFFAKGIEGDVRSLVKAVESGDYTSMSRAATTIAINLSKFKGLYQATPGSGVWQFYEDRNDLLLKYWVGESERNLVISTNGSTWSTTVNADGETITVNVPQTIDVTLTTNINSTSNLMTLKIRSDVKDGSSMNITNSLRLANIQYESTIKGTSTKLTEDVNIYHHNVSTLYRTPIVSYTTEISGSNLCSANSWHKALESENEVEIANLITSVTSDIMVMKSLEIKYNVSNFRSFISNIDAWYDTSIEADPKGSADNSAKALKSAVTGELRYSGEHPNKVRGTLGWEAYMCDDDPAYQSWAVRPTVTFVSDGATYDIASYFGNNRFLSIENKIKNIIKTYASYFN